MIIGLNGRLKSGKDTTYAMIWDMYPHAERVSFADPLKDSAAASLKMNREIMEALKNDEDIKLVLSFPASEISEARGSLWQELQEWQMNMREYLQLYGTEAHREVFGDNFWVDMALPLNVDHDHRLLVVTDVRFPNEAQRVKDLGGVVWKIERETATGHGAHASEQNLDAFVDVFIDNTGSLYELREIVRQQMNRTLVPTL